MYILNLELPCLPQTDFVGTNLDEVAPLVLFVFLLDLDCVFLQKEAEI